MTETLQRPTIERLYSMPAGTLTTERGNILFISYETIVGYKRVGREPVFTAGWKKSRTTQEQLAKWRKLYGEGKEAPEAIFKERVKAIGFSAEMKQAPHSFA
jgi:hypothetical protein